MPWLGHQASTWPGAGGARLDMQPTQWKGWATSWPPAGVAQTEKLVSLFKIEDDLGVRARRVGERWGGGVHGAAPRSLAGAQEYLGGDKKLYLQQASRIRSE